MSALDIKTIVKNNYLALGLSSSEGSKGRPQSPLCMIPDLPPSCSDTERLDFYSKLLGNLEDQSSVHVNWHTHRQNPHLCWLCDVFILASKVMYIADKFLPKSALDIGTELSSEDESDSEIESESLNNDEEGDMVPEYDLSDPQNQTGDIQSLEEPDE